MEFVNGPKVYHLATTALVWGDLQRYLKDVGAEGWETSSNIADGECLIEICGKSCYRSFSTELNPNLTKVRTGDNHKYITEGIVKVGHGSVLEHVHETFALAPVSRGLTHELVRHRIASYSQESLRFVRLTDLKAYYPHAFKEPFLAKIRNYLTEKKICRPVASEGWVKDKFREVYEYLEQIQIELANALALDDLEAFHLKKTLTSAMRRLAPIGLSTAVIMTTNLRQWRLIIEKRTNAAAEEEIREATYLIYEKLKTRYPSVFEDAGAWSVPDSMIPEIKFRHSCG